MASTTLKKDDIKPTAPAVEKSSLVDLSSLTPDERAIFSRVSAEGKEWETITEDSALDFSSMVRDPFELPDLCKKLEREKKFKFRWVRRDITRIDEVRSLRPPFQWWLVNSTQPVGSGLEKSIDSSTGGVHLMDQILVFKPWWMWEKESRYQAMLADSKGDLLKKEGEERDGIKASARMRKLGEVAHREEVQAGDVHFAGEAEADAAVGRPSLGTVTDSDLTLEG